MDPRRQYQRRRSSALAGTRTTLGVLRFLDMQVFCVHSGDFESHDGTLQMSGSHLGRSSREAGCHECFVFSFLQPHANAESDLSGYGKFVGKPSTGKYPN
jgi:hypothetical protein